MSSRRLVTRARRVSAFNRQVLARLSALPGVESVTLADFSPLSFSIHTDYLQIEGYVPQPHESMEISRAYRRAELLSHSPHLGDFRP